MENNTRLFYVVDSIEDNKELFTTGEVYYGKKSRIIGFYMSKE